MTTLESIKSKLGYEREFLLKCETLTKDEMLLLLVGYEAVINAVASVANVSAIVVDSDVPKSVQRKWAALRDKVCRPAYDSWLETVEKKETN